MLRRHTLPLLPFSVKPFILMGLPLSFSLSLSLPLHPNTITPTLLRIRPHFKGIIEVKGMQINFKLYNFLILFEELSHCQRPPPVSQLFISFESQCPFLDAVGIMVLANLAPNFFSNFDVARQLHII